MPTAAAYVTVELDPGDLPAPTDPRQAPGELIEGGGYHYYPSQDQVAGWLDEAGFLVEEQAEGDGYWHLLVVRGGPRSDRP